MRLVISETTTTPISPDLMGVFFEDINYGADGGLYAEMIENRSFEFMDCYGEKGDYYCLQDGLYSWKPYPEAEAADAMVVIGSPLSEENPHYLRLTAKKAGAGISNQAYSGITLKKGAAYHISFYARTVRYGGAVTAKVVKDGVVYAQGVVEKLHLNAADETKKDLADLQDKKACAGTIRNYWHRYEMTVVAEESVQKALFVLELSEAGVVELDFVSMIPADAVEGLFRKDTFEVLKALKPAFMRFPGGCIIEGNTMSNRYRFKDTLKRPEDRKGNWNRWAVHNAYPENGFHSVFAHYNQTYGIGYYEFFLLCEKIGAKALPVMNVGLACQYQSYEYMEIGSPEFEQMVQDAVDLIAFANDSADSEWGKVRAQLGHPEPFGLEYLGIGNEQWQLENNDFFERYRIFEKRIHEAYPQIRLIGSAGPDVVSEHYTNAWSFYRKEIQKNPNFVYAIDEHYYMPPKWFLEHNTFYDEYDRGIKVFAGEYAAHDPEISEVNVSKNNVRAAISEAAFLTGIERNSDVVALSSYAPLFSRVGYTQWSPDLIWMDEEKTWGTPSYYVQKLFSQYAGTVNVDMLGQEKTLREQQIFVNICKGKEGNFIVKLVNAGKEAVSISFEAEDGSAKLAYEKTILTGEPMAYNCPEAPERIVPQTEACSCSALTIEPNSFAVILLR